MPLVLDPIWRVRVSDIGFELFASRLAVGAYRNELGRLSPIPGGMSYMLAVGRMRSNTHFIRGRDIDTEGSTRCDLACRRQRGKEDSLTTLTSPTSTDRPRARSAARLRDVTALSGALFVLVALGAFIAAGDAPDGDASAAAVIAHYGDNRTQGIVAAVILALAAIPTLAFGARLRERARLAIGPDRTLPNFAFAAGVVTAAGFLGAAAIHLTLSDYARDLDPAAVQALNALDGDSFVLFTTGIATIVLAGSLIAVRSRLLPTWPGEAIMSGNRQVTGLVGRIAAGRGGPAELLRDNASPRDGRAEGVAAR